MSGITIRSGGEGLVPQAELQGLADSIGNASGAAVTIDAPYTGQPYKGFSGMEVIEIVLDESVQIAVGAATTAVGAWAKDKVKKRKKRETKVEILNEEGRLIEHLEVHGNKVDVECPECGREQPPARRCHYCATDFL